MREAELAERRPVAPGLIPAMPGEGPIPPEPEEPAQSLVGLTAVASL